MREKRRLFLPSRDPLTKLGVAASNLFKITGLDWFHQQSIVEAPSKPEFYRTATSAIHASSFLITLAAMVHSALGRLTLLARPIASNMRMKYHPMSTCHQCQPRRAEPTEEW